MMQTREGLLICTACGTQFDVPADKPLKACRICDDPRQFVPPNGQSWTSLAQMRGKFHNVFKQDDVESRMTSIITEPKFAIGQRCILLETPDGNVLWDCIAFLDQETVDYIKSKGNLKAIVISHPHYYTTHLDWAKTFDCPVYFAKDDERWVNQPDPEERRKLFATVSEPIVDDVVAIRTGGHFPGSLCLLWDKKLFIADTLVTVPSALYHIDRPPGTTSYAFMWSIPNMIPLPPNEMLKMWQALKPFEFESTHGAFAGLDVRDKNVKGRVLESMKIQARNEGWHDVAILEESI
ncbi:hypothetical protein DOTSEDRAFT_71814 [Dothistroma septosporum NZE10]|uniref:Metallo-beta-lactamase domain-containing protein n=1 Tax=Dothistroma septosporum (strain NZE10 / CBS 128990) TaxID=675120 RepID=N1PNX0_DOTSN|nr:hypothetical protein DOTSEDRAFT_71814 [Dothistroma septosporum NZE10]